MKLILESERLEDYRGEIPPLIRFDTPLVQEQIKRIKEDAATPEERAYAAFQVARDDIRHSFDSGCGIVTIGSEDVLREREGICFAKAHLLAALLRGMAIPVGFCYQRVLRQGTIESGYALHGLNALWLEPYGWFRVDPRGNKPGIDSQFSPQEEKLAYPIREHLGEVDYPNVYTTPLPTVISAMQESHNIGELFYKRPEAV